MRNWTKVVLPLALAMMASGCDAEITTGDKAGDKDHRRSADAGPTVTQNFALTGFTGVKVSGPDDVTIRQGDAFAISAKGPKGEIDELEIKLDGSVLSIGRKREGFTFGSRDHDGVEISVTLPKLSAIKLSGSGSIDADTVDGDAVEASISGSGDLKIAKLNGKSAQIGISGSGDIEIGEGAVASGDYSVTGSGGIDARGLVAQNVEISIAGSGDVDTQATGAAEVSIMGSGDVTIAGGAKCSTRAMGSGTATCK